MRSLSPRDVARALGVSESSVKRWVDDGVLAAMRTAGGHRRIAVAEAVRFARESGAPVVRPEVILGAPVAAPVGPFGPAAGAEAGERLQALLEGDDGAAARALLLSLYVAGWPVAGICDGPVRLALERIGALWQHGPAGIVVEHRATDTCVRALAEMRALLAPAAAGAPVALGASPSGDPYLLPSAMAAAVLADLGCQDYNLGPEVPLPVLAEAAERYRPRIVWLAMSVERGFEDLAAAADFASRLAGRRATLVVGGRGAPTGALPAGILRLNSMAELAAFARGVLESSRTE